MFFDAARRAAMALRHRSNLTKQTRAYAHITSFPLAAPADSADDTRASEWNLGMHAWQSAMRQILHRSCSQSRPPPSDSEHIVHRVSASSGTSTWSSSLDWRSALYVASNDASAGARDLSCT